MVLFHLPMFSDSYDVFEQLTNEVYDRIGYFSVKDRRASNSNSLMIIQV